MNDTVLAIDVGSKGIKFVFWHPKGRKIEIIDALVFLGEEFIHIGGTPSPGKEMQMVRDTLKDYIRKSDISLSADEVSGADKVYVLTRDRKRSILDVLHALFKCLLACVSKRFDVIDIKKSAVTITVPAQTDIQKKTEKIFKEAADEYGFETDNMKFLPEPEAAAQAWEWLPYFLRQYHLGMDKNSRNYQLDDEIVVVDCGGGTLDWAFLRRNKESGTDFKCVGGDHSPRTKDMIDGSFRTDVTEEHIESAINDLKKYIDESGKKTQILLIGGNYGMLKKKFKKDKYRIVLPDSLRASLLATVVGGFLYENAAAYYSLGRENIKENPRIAVAAFEKALAIDPSHEKACLALVEACIDLDELDRAKKAGLPDDISPLDRAQLIRKGVGQANKKTSEQKFDEAIAYLEFARRIDPNNMRTRLEIAKIRYFQGNLERVEDLYDALDILKSWRDINDDNFSQASELLTAEAIRRVEKELAGAIWIENSDFKNAKAYSLIAEQAYKVAQEANVDSGPENPHVEANKGNLERVEDLYDALDILKGWGDINDDNFKQASKLLIEEAIRLVKEELAKRNFESANKYFLIAEQACKINIEIGGAHSEQSNSRLDSLDKVGKVLQKVLKIAPDSQGAQNMMETLKGKYIEIFEDSLRQLKHQDAEEMLKGVTSAKHILRKFTVIWSESSNWEKMSRMLKAAVKRSINDCFRQSKLKAAAGILREFPNEQRQAQLSEAYKRRGMVHRLNQRFEQAKTDFALADKFRVETHE